MGLVSWQEHTLPGDIIRILSKVPDAVTDAEVLPELHQCLLSIISVAAKAWAKVVLRQ